ncbi:calcium-binding protein, partial [Tsuneonella sp. HG222]
MNLSLPNIGLTVGTTYAFLLDSTYGTLSAGGGSFTSNDNYADGFFFYNHNELAGGAPDFSGVSGVGSYGDLAFTLTYDSDIPGNVSSTASISLGASVFSDIGFNGDQDWFKIHLTPGQYEIRQNGVSQSDPEVFLYNSSGILLGQNDDGGPGLDSLLVYTITAEGDYFVGAGQFGTSQGTYELNIVRTPALAVTDRFTIAENQQVNANLFLDNGAGPDNGYGSTLQVGAVARNAAAVGTNYVLPSGATVRITTDGQILYTPGPTFGDLAAQGSGATNTALVDTFSYSLVGGGTADVIVTINGVDSADRLLGSAGNDNLRAGLFDDVLIGGAGADTLNGGEGSDTASYADNGGGVFVNLTLGVGSGNYAQGDTYTSIENVTGSIFNDFLIGDTGVNRLEGGAGNDTIIGGLGADVLIGGPGVDTLSFEDNSGTVFVNLLTGMGYNNAAQGDTFSGFENVIGGLFDDTIIGDNGNNRLNGAMGAD